jgi:hypothetical protein
MTASMPAPSTLVRPFTVAISDSNPETVPDWSQGVRLENAKSLIAYWEREYDWRRFESELDRFPHFLTTIDGLDIHFIHVKSKNPNAMPLILTHGWPGSIVEFLKLIGLLTDPVRSEETSKIHLTSSCRRCPGLGSPKSRPKQGGLFPVSQLRG